MGEVKQSVFEFYLRTGRIVGHWDIEQNSSFETKFNPWHDPLNGQFTFAGMGKFSGGGGSFGGAGATGGWGSKPPPKSQLRTLPARPDDKRSERTLFKPPMDSLGSRPERPKAQPVQRHDATVNPLAKRAVTKNGYTFNLDSQGNPQRISGALHLDASEKRSRQAQARAGGAERRSTDDGGHYIGVRFGGPRDKFNHFAQDSNFNRGAYRKLEDEWAKAIRRGDRVFVDIKPHYVDGGSRPDQIKIIWDIAGIRSSTTFHNGPGGEKDEK